MIEARKDEWMPEGKLNEVKFCQLFCQEHKLIYADGAFFSLEGRIRDERQLRQMIYQVLSGNIKRGLGRRVDGLLAVLKMEAGRKPLPIEDSVIHLQNGTYRLAEGFTSSKDVCRFRLPVSYRPTLPNPDKWLAFLDDLLEPEDIDTLQEFMGYCLVPTNVAQKMLIITGRGGEGKSRIGVVMHALLGENMNQGSLYKVETSPFARADLEHKLLLVDDDINLMKLPSTSYLKTIVTCDGPMDLERKGIQSYQGRMYCRLMAFGNGGISSESDRSVGFYRRQIILSAKPKNPKRVDEPFLGQMLAEEADQIFLWCLTGLYRLMENNYCFTLSKRTKENISQAYRNENTIACFMGSQGYLVFDSQASTSSRLIYEYYRDWCQDNSIEPLGMKKFSEILHTDSEFYGLKYDYNVPIGNGRRARGYRGIRMLPRV